MTKIIIIVQEDREGAFLWTGQSRRQHVGLLHLSFSREDINDIGDISDISDISDINDIAAFVFT